MFKYLQIMCAKYYMILKNAARQLKLARLLDRPTALFLLSSLKDLKSW